RRAANHVAATHELATPLTLLIDDGRALHHAALTAADHEIARRIELERVGAVDLHANDGRIGARRDDEVVLETALITVNHDVDTRIDSLVTHARVRRDPGAPGRGILPAV